MAKKRIKDIDWEAAAPVNTTVEQPVTDIDADMDAAIQRFVQNNSAAFEGAATAHMILFLRVREPIRCVACTTIAVTAGLMP